jgi:hypothetical protein
MWFYMVIYEIDSYPERLYELPTPPLIEIKREGERKLEIYKLSGKTGFVRDTYENGSPTVVIIGVEDISGLKTEDIYCLPACDNDSFFFVDLY